MLPGCPTEEVTFDLTCLRDADVVRPTESDTERPLRRVAALVAAGDRLRVMADHISSGLIDGIWRAVVRSGAEFEAVITTGGLDTIRAASVLAARFRDLLETAETTVFVSNEVARCVIVVDDTVGIVHADPEDRFRAVILFATERVREWASATVRTYRDGSEPLNPDAFTA